MLILTHTREDGEMGGSTTTVISVSEERERLDAKIKKINEDRIEANALMADFEREMEANPDPERGRPNWLTSIENQRRTDYEQELSRKYPFSWLCEGFHGEGFDIKEIEVL